MSDNCFCFFSTSSIKADGENCFVMVSKRIGYSLTWSDDKMNVLTEKTILDSKKEAMELNPLFIAQSHAVSPSLFSS